jgi:putative ABC transport system substrate-binding protein
MRRREFIIALGGAAAWPLVARAQQAATRVVGVLGAGGARGGNFAAFQRRLAEMGYVEGRNLAFEFRSANFQEDQLAALAADLVQLRVDAIVALGGPPIVAAKAATTSIPIIFQTGFDPVAAGFVASLNRPGGNATGVSVLNIEVLAKRLELLHELVPTARLVALLHSRTSVALAGDRARKRLDAAADALGVKLLPVEASRPDDFEEAFTKISSSQAEALLVGGDAVFEGNRERIVRLADKHRIPAIYPIRTYADAGGLVSYGTDYRASHGQVGDYVGRVLNGEKPENLPVQQVTKLELVISAKVAKALGLTLPPSLLVRADEVID